MARASQTVRIQRPAAEVFDALNDPELAPQWSSTVKSVDLSGPPKVGQTFTVEGSFLGVGVTMNCEVTDHDEPTRYAYRSQSPLRMTLESDLEAVDGETDLTMTVDVDPGRLFAAAGPLFKRQVRKQLEGDLKRLKALLEE
ncbi:MAG TPA: SRPBCC family protein [Egibacteraceae bacterium]|nr:SRPBCC family protein [Egibacteraceae bacterium]